MGIDAVILNHTKKRMIDTCYRLHSFHVSSGPNLITWLTNSRTSRDDSPMRGSWAHDEIEVCGDGNEIDDYHDYDAAIEEIEAWKALWKDDSDDPEDKWLCEHMRSITL